MLYHLAEELARDGYIIRRKGWNDESDAVWRKGKLIVLKCGEPQECSVPAWDLAADDWDVRVEGEKECQEWPF
jgi:hypothetical protein